ncbi:MAG: hypothetical protein VW235_03225, partial [Rhodospirillaceae bacterium]
SDPIEFTNVGTSATDIDLTLADGTVDPIQVVGTSNSATVFRDADTDTFIKVEATPDDDTITMATAGTERLTITAAGPFIGTPQQLQIQDKRSSGTNGGTNTTGTWQTRTLQTEVFDEIGSTLSSNQFTLPAGTYSIDGWAVAFRVNNHKSRLYNTTDSSTAVLGSVAYSTNAGGAGDTNMSYVRGRFTITDTKTFEIQTYTQTAQTNTGLGEAGGTDTGSTDEIFIDLLITRLA